MRKNKQINIRDELMALLVYIVLILKALKYTNTSLKDGITANFVQHFILRFQLVVCKYRP